ncbi:Uncharacterized protein DBV15_01829 [Temnothorax longispinosus]|uniref:Uncharacterized protein n=1 Tax=Temnothorax longispinosus TaxID=300112 RepID=A0A4S2KUX6_9HYME|nr:Uncharacterized protein DBV15_01829 [Temnothorax longispinosus]
MALLALTAAATAVMIDDLPHIFKSLSVFKLLIKMLKDDFTAVSSALRQYLPEKDTPYILDIDLDFFSTKNPFKDLHERVNLYDKLAPLFTYKRAESNDPEMRRPDDFDLMYAGQTALPVLP